MLEKLFYILIAYLPFQIALNPYPDIDLMSGRVLIIALFLYWLWTIRKQVKATFSKLMNFQSVFLLAFLFIAVLSLTQAQEVGWGIRKILVFCSIFPLYFLTVGIFNDFEKVKKIIKILVFSSLPLSAIGIIQFFSQFIFLPGKVTNFWAQWIAPVFYGRSFGWLVSANPSWLMELGGTFYIRATSLFPDPHTFAVYLGLIIPLALSLLLLTRENRKLLIAVSCMAFIALFLTFSRGGYFAMLATLIFFIVFLAASGRLSKISSKWKILLALGLLLLIALLVVPVTPISQCFYSAFDFSRFSNAERVKIWKEALDSLSSHPWLGVGIGNFPKVVDPWSKYLSPINAHSVYLDIISEMGIFAFWVWLMLFGVTIFNLFHPAPAETRSYISFGLAGSLIWFSCHELFETSIYNPTILAILMVILGLCSVVLNHRINKSN